MSDKPGRAEKALIRRRARSVESFRGVADTLGQVSLGLGFFVVTRGQFSMIDVVNHYVKELKAAHVSLWTWVIADYEVEVVTRLLTAGDILSGRLIIDYSAGRRNPVLIDQWRERFGAEQVRICRNHAKIARIWNNEYRILARGSCNLNFNPRFEQIDITEGGEDFELVSRIEDDLPVLPREHTKAEASAASRLGAAFDLKTLEVFEGLKEFRVEEER